MPQKKPSPAQTEKKATPKPKGKAAPKKAVKPASPAKKATPKKIPAQTQPPTKWRVASPQPKATEEPQPAPCRALMVIPQPEPLAPWEQFKHDLPGSFDGFIAEIAGGSHMAAFCKERGINYTTLLKFVAADASRSEMYTRAREDRADVLADEIVSIADEAEVVAAYKDGHVVLGLDATGVQRNKLRVDARKWAASKLKPRTYGDKLAVEGTINHKTMSDDQLLGRLAQLGIAVAGITRQQQGPSDA